MENALVQREVKIFHRNLHGSLNSPHKVILLEGTQLRLQYLSVRPSLRRKLKSHLEWPPAPGWSPHALLELVSSCTRPKKRRPKMSAILNWCKTVCSNQIKRPTRVVTSSAHGFMLQPSTPVLFLKQMLEKTRGLTLADAYQLSISHKDAKFTGLMERMPAPQDQIEGIRAFARTVAVIKGIAPGFENGNPPMALLKHGPLERWGKDWWASMSENTESYLHVIFSNAEWKCYDCPINQYKVCTYIIVYIYDIFMHMAHARNILTFSCA